MSAKNTVRLHRVLATTPEKLFRAFTDPDAKCKWLPPNGFTAKMHSHEFKVGGTYRMSFKNFTTNKDEFFSGTINEIVPNKRLVYSDKFKNPALPGKMKVTVTLNEVMVGTELNIIQENIPDQSRQTGRAGNKSIARQFYSYARSATSIMFASTIALAVSAGMPW